jgi:hypothetical protein
MKMQMVTNAGRELRCLSRITRPSHPSMDEHDFF